MREKVSWFNLMERKGRWRPKITLVEVVKNDMLIKEVTESIALDEIEWWKIIHVVDLV